MTSYVDAVRTIVDGFDFEYCAECGFDLDAHAISPGPFDLPFAWCLKGDDEGEAK
jgi:hypothetical protein